MGDKVSLNNQSNGIVMAIIDDDLFSEDTPKENWDYLNTRVLINFENFGLIYYDDDVESDVYLISRS